MDKLIEAAQEIERAITVEGPSPPRHRKIMRSHKLEWPTLWEAIRKLRVALKEEQSKQEQWRNQGA